MKKISIVIPIFNEVNNLDELFSQLEVVISRYRGYDWEIVFINDGSTDGSLDKLVKLCQRNKLCRVIDFSRNFGKEIALSAGLVEAKSSSAVICMDADLQHPPSLIGEFLSKWEGGWDVVVGVRIDTKNKSILRAISSKIYCALMNLLTHEGMIDGLTDFGLYDRVVVDAYSLMTERQRFFRGIINWLGFKKIYVYFQANERLSGNPTYSASKLLNLAINSITGYSLWPLKLLSYVGIFTIILSGMLLCWMIGDRLIMGQPSFTPIATFVVFNTFLMGVILAAIGLVAIYIGNIHTEVLNRPLYIIRKKYSVLSDDKENNRLN